MKAQWPAQLIAIAPVFTARTSSNPNLSSTKLARTLKANALEDFSHNSNNPNMSPPRQPPLASAQLPPNYKATARRSAVTLYKLHLKPTTPNLYVELR